MRTISRRSILGGLALAAGFRPANADTGEKLSVATSDGGVALTRYAAEGQGKRAGVVILHGARGIELRPRAYERYANALTAAGIDAYLIRYYSPADDLALEKMPTPEGRKAYHAGRFDAWSGRVSAASPRSLRGPTAPAGSACSVSRSAAMLRRRPRPATIASPPWPYCMAACRRRSCLR
jgi:carboxymethylenebutenolidase